MTWENISYIQFFKILLKTHKIKIEYDFLATGMAIIRKNVNPKHWSKPFKQFLNRIEYLYYDGLVLSLLKQITNYSPSFFYEYCP